MHSGTNNAKMARLYYL